MSHVVVTVCCCGALSFLRLGGRKDRSLCHVCAKAAGGPAPGERLGRAASGVRARVEWVRTGGGEETSGGSGGGGRMHRSSLRTGSSSGGAAGPMAGGGGLAVLRPPKPPCWRDFVAQGSSARKDHFAAATSTLFAPPDVRTGTDLGGGGGGDGGGGGGGGGRLGVGGGA